MVGLIKGAALAAVAAAVVALPAKADAVADFYKGAASARQSGQNDGVREDEA